MNLNLFIYFGLGYGSIEFKILTKWNNENKNACDLLFFIVNYLNSMKSAHFPSTIIVAGFVKEMKILVITDAHFIVRHFFH